MFSPRFRMLSIFLSVLLAGCGGSGGEGEGEPGTEVVKAPVEEEVPEPDIPALQPVDDRLIVPGQRVGLIVAESTATSLAAGYGAEAITDAPYPLGEGQSEPGSALFASDPARRLLILWGDLEHRAKPLAVRLENGGSTWKTAEGLTVGLTLKEVEALNGKPFLLYGFEWDFGGQLVDSNGGALRDLPHEDPEGGFRGGDLLLSFQPAPEAVAALAEGEYAQVSGDGTFESSHPVMQKLNPVVTEMTVNFPNVD